MSSPAVPLALAPDRKCIRPRFFRCSASGSYCGWRFNQPCGNNAFVIDIGNFVRLKFQGGRELREVRQERLIHAANPIRAGKFSTGHIRQPVPSFSQRIQRIAAVSVNIHAGKIGDEPLVAIPLNVQDKDPLRLLMLAAEALGTEKETELERHIEARQFVHRVELGPRKVMNAVAAFLDQAVNLIDPSLATVVELPCRAGAESAEEDREDECAKSRSEGLVERAVDEDVVSRQGAALALSGQDALHRCRDPLVRNGGLLGRDRRQNIATGRRTAAEDGGLPVLDRAGDGTGRHGAQCALGKVRRQGARSVIQISFSA